MKQAIYFSFLLLLIAGTCIAQKPQLGFTVGTTVSTYKAKADAVSFTSKSKLGLTVGLTSSLPMGKNLSFQPGLNFVQKGGTFKMEGTKDVTTLNYLEIPLNLVYSFPSSSGKFFIGAGPSLSFGLSGKDKWDSEGQSGTDKIKFGSGEDKDFKTMEASLNFLAGYQFRSGMLLAINYNAGMNNLFQGGDGDNGTYHNRYFGIRLGYMFGH
jgi:hypothetical protein